MVSPLVIDERYHLVRQIRRSDDVALFQVRDVATDRLLALKVFLAPDEATLQAYQTQLRLLSTLAHPHIAETVDSGTIERSSQFTFGSKKARYLYLATEFLEGPNFQTAFPPEAQGTPAERRAFLQTASQVCDALDYVHRRRLIHLDIEPENILLAAPPVPDHVVAKLIDFDFSQKVSTPLGARVRGTLLLVSPEVLKDSLISEQADLYSLGATLYLVTTGAYPFAAALQRDLMAQILADQPIAPRERNPRVSPGLSSLIMELLRKDPAGRPASAQAVRDRIDALIAETEGQAPRRMPPPGRRDGERSSEEPGLVGREAPFRLVTGELEHLGQGETLHRFLFLVGQSGAGKRRFLAEIERYAALQGVDLFRTDATLPRAQPYAAVNDLIAQLGERLPANQALLLRARDALAIAAGTPVERFAPTDAQHGRDLRKVLFSQLSDCIVRSLEGRRALFVLEHIDHADPVEISFFGFLARLLHVRSKRFAAGMHGARAGASLVLLGTLSGAPPETPDDPLRALLGEPFASTIALENLSADKTAELIKRSRGGSALSPETLACIQGVTGGHPLYLSDIQELLFRLSPEEFALRIKELPSGMSAYFRTLVSSAAPEELRLGYALWLAGKPLPIEVLARVLALDAGAIERTATAGKLLKRRNGNVDLRWWPAPNEFPPIPGENVTRIAVGLALELERQGKTVEAIRLYAAAGRTESIGLTIAYAERAERLLAWEGAAKLAAEVRRLVAPDDAAFAARFARLEELSGNHDEALALLSSAPVPPEGTAARCLDLARLEASVGEPQEALRLLEEAMKAAGKGAPESGDRIRAMLALAQLHLESKQVERAEALLKDAVETVEAPPRLRAQARFLLGKTAMSKKSWAEAVAHFQRAAKEHEANGDSHLVAEDFLWSGSASIGRGDFGQALSFFRHALALAQENQNPKAEALAHDKLGMTHYRRGELDAALGHLSDGHALWDELGDTRMLADALNNLGLVFRSQGNLDEAVRHFQEGLGLLSALDDEEGQAAVLNNLASVLDAHGKYREALTQSFRALELRKRQRDRTSIAYSYFRIGDIYRQMGDLDHALSFAEKSLGLREEVSDKVGIAHTLYLLGDIHLLQGRYGKSLRRLRQGLIQFQALGDRMGKMPLLLAIARLYSEIGSHSSAVEFVDQGEEIAREHVVPVFQAGTRHVRALVKEAEGDLYGAETLLKEAVGILRTEPGRKSLAECLLSRARVLLELGNLSRGEETLERAYSLVSEIGCRDLSPQYFLLRARTDLLGHKPSFETAERLLARALGEAQELSLLPLLSWIHLELSLLCRRKNAVQAGREHFARAEEILWQLQEDLPLRLQQTFSQSKLAQRARAEGAEYAHVPEAAPRAAVPAQSEELSAIRQHSRNLERLQEITQALNTELVLDRVLARIIDAALELANAERGFLIIGTGKDQKFEVARNLLGEDLADPTHEISQSIATEVLRTGQALVTNDAVGDARLAKFKSVRDLKLMSIAGLPLSVKERTIGVLYLDNRTVKNAFRKEDLSLLSTLCDQAAIAIENARLIDDNVRKQKALEESNIRIAGLNRRLTEKLRERTFALKHAHDLLETRFSFDNIVGKSKPMQDVFHVITRVSKTDLPVLIEGESGTGKELIANAIHFNSNRRAQPIISENCGAITSTLLETELFGHMRGAFTGAIKEKKGLFEVAHRGTLFLDEVGDMDIEMQKKLLRVLEEGEIRRVGGKDVIKVDVRLITATNHNLRELVLQNAFREDLFWRLNVIPIRIPPLRERKEDIPLLAEHFLLKIAEETDSERKRLSPGALRGLLGYHWPGNVRELRHFLERAHLLARGEVIGEEDVTLETEAAEGAPKPGVEFAGLSLREAKGEFIKVYIRRILEEQGGVVSRAARACDISRETFHRLIRKYKLSHRDE